MDLIETQKKTYSISQRHPWETARVHVVYSLIVDAMPRVLSGKTVILDMGCGDVFLSEELSKRLPLAEIIAVDTAFSENDVKNYGKKFQGKPISVYPTLEAAVEARVRIINVVLLLDVIEHVRDDAGLLQRLVNVPLVTNDTAFLITAPAYQALFSSHDLFLKHFRRYTNASLTEKMRQASLRIEKIGYFFTLLLLPRMLGLLVEKIGFSPIEGKYGRWQLEGWESKHLDYQDCVMPGF